MMQYQLLPDLTTEEYEGLKASIAEHGVVVSIEGFFRSHHIISTTEQRAAAEAVCRDSQVIPFIREMPAGDNIKAVWWGYLPFGCGDVVEHPGWRQFGDIVWQNTRQAEKGNGPEVKREREAEGAIETALVARLKAEGKTPVRQVRTTAGIIDVLAGDTLYEVKARLDRDAILKATGQVLVYGQCCSITRRVIVGRPGDGLSLIPYLKELHIDVEVWND